MYKEIFDNLLEYSERYTLVRGYVDIINYKDISFRCKWKGQHDRHLMNQLAEDFTIDNIWILSGCGHIESIFEDFLEYDFDTDKEGVYEFKALLKYINSESDEYGRTTMPGYYEIVHMELDFKETFVERDRDRKLNELLPIFRII